MDEAEGASPALPRRVRITPAQLRVLGAMAKGLSYNAIGELLFLSPTTVRSHVEALQTRLGVSNNVTVVLAAVTVGLLSNSGWPVELTGICEFDPTDLGL